MRLLIVKLSSMGDVVHALAIWLKKASGASLPEELWSIWLGINNAIAALMATVPGNRRHFESKGRPQDRMPGCDRADGIPSYRTPLSGGE